MAYITRAELKERVEGDQNLGSDFDDRLDDLIEVVQAAVETFTGRVWEDPPEEARTFKPRGTGRVLDIDEATSINTVEERRNFGSWETVSTDDWELFASGKYLDSLARKTGAWPCSSVGEPTVRVTAIWASTSSPPADVKEACLLLGDRLFQRPEAALGFTSGGIETAIFTITRNDPDFFNLLQFKRKLGVA